MKNQYVGDIGDYGKYGLLRFLIKKGIKIGVNWYLTENDGSTDGKFTKYLQTPAERKYDPELFDCLKDIADRRDKTVGMIESFGILPGTSFFSEILKSSSLNVKARGLTRRLWFNNSTLLLSDAELIFADPDNGISFTKTAKTKDSEKFILPEDVCDYYDCGKNVVFYCHKGRRKQEDWEQAKVEIRKYIRDAQILGITCHRGTQRSYIFVLHPDCYLRYEEILEEFLHSVWADMFTRENIVGNADLPSHLAQTHCPQTHRPQTGAGISLEPLSAAFSVCKVEDYSGIDLDQPFVFTGRTDEEKSLVCPTEIVPENTAEREDGWRAFRICGVLDFSLIGILAGITQILADRKIGLFAISTYNTDYVLTKDENFESAVLALKAAGYTIKD